MRRTLACAWLVASVLIAPRAQADACDSAQPEAGAPVRTPHGPADFGMLPEACGATMAAVRGRLDILIAEDDFYGQLLAGAAFVARLELPGGSWLSAHLPGVTYRFIANATVEAESVDLSASTVGYHVPVAAGPTQVAPYLRLMVPTETVFENATRWGVEQGISTVIAGGRYFELMLGYSAPLLLTSNQQSTLSLFMPAAALDFGVRPARWFEGVLGVSARFVPADEEPFESLDPRAALRFYPYRGLLLELSGALPILGRDRTNGVAGLALGWIAPD